LPKTGHPNKKGSVYLYVWCSTSTNLSPKQLTSHRVQGEPANVRPTYILLVTFGT